MLSQLKSYKVTSFDRGTIMKHHILKLTAIAAALSMAGAFYAPAQSPNENAKAQSGCGFDKPCPKPPPVLAHPAPKPSMVGKPATDWHPTPKISKPLDKGNVPPPTVPRPTVSRPNTTTSNCVATAREFEARVDVFNHRCTGVGSVSQAALYRQCAEEKAALASEQARICALCPGCK